MPPFAVVKAKRRPLVITPLSAFQGLSNFPVIGDSSSVKGYFSLELLPNRSELSPVHGRLLPGMFQAPAVHGKTQERPVKFRRRSTAANHDLAAATNRLDHLQCRAGGAASQSPQVLAGEPLIKDDGFASRSLDSSA